LPVGFVAHLRQRTDRIAITVCQHTSTHVTSTLRGLVKTYFTHKNTRGIRNIRDCIGRTNDFRNCCGTNIVRSFGRISNSSTRFRYTRTLRQPSISSRTYTPICIYIYICIALTFASREIIETLGAFVAKLSAEILFARTLSARVLALPTPRPVQETLARLTVRVPVVPLAAPVAVRRRVRRFTFALAETLRAITGRIETVAVASCVKYVIYISAYSATVTAFLR